MNPRAGGSYGLTTLTGLVIANMIGAGVFTTSGFALADLGTPNRVLWAWLVAGGIALCGAAAYGAMARALPRSGGEYVFLSTWVHPALGNIAGWVSLLAGFTSAIALSALTLETYLRPMGGWLATGAILLGIALHGLRKAPGAWVQNSAVVAKLCLLVGFIFLAAQEGVLTGAAPTGTASAAAPPFSWAMFAQSLMWISLSYAGFNAAVYVSGEARSPMVVSRALLLGTFVTMLLYLGLNAVFVRAAPAEALAGQEAIAAVAAASMNHPWLETCTNIVIPLALFTSVSAMMLAGPRVYAQMATEGTLPVWLRFHGETPLQAIAFQGLLAIVVVWMASIRELLNYLGFTLSLSSAAAVASLGLAWYRGRVTTSHWILVAAGAYVAMTLVSACIGAWLNPWQGIAGLITLIIGWGGYVFANRKPRPAS